MSEYRTLSPAEIERLTAAGNRADDWSRILVAHDFDASQLSGCRLGGSVTIGSQTSIVDSFVADCRIGARTHIRAVTEMSCCGRSTFGNGVRVRAVNECGGRSVAIYDGLSAQTAYAVAMYRHRPLLAQRYGEFVELYARSAASEQGSVGDDCRIVGARFIRRMRIGNGVHIDGASVLDNGTLLDGARVGVDVKAFDFIAAENSTLDTGATCHRCFIGENAIVANGFTAENTLFFASCHCENGEASAVFAGPFTVSHHKSSLLIAGIFSFFNAGSGTNQSNHLFKSGAVHQSVHRRGCKFASNAYVMSPAAEGAFTMVMGRHVKHHDTSALPFSYLIESNGASLLMPALNLRSYGTVRDIGKWSLRDNRSVRRDVVDFDEYNPCLTGAALRGAALLRELRDAAPEAESYRYRNTVIKASMLAHGIRLYDKYITCALGDMLARGLAAGCTAATATETAAGEWVDMAGQYVPLRAVEQILDDFEAGLITPAEMDARLRECDDNRTAWAFGWALGVLAERLGHAPSAAEVEECIREGEVQRACFRELTDADRAKEFADEMAAGYGTDAAVTAAEAEVRRADFDAVHWSAAEQHG